MAREQIRLQFGKYNGDEHGYLDLVILGHDKHGLWLGGGPARVSRPGAKPVQWFQHVVLVPNDAWWVATFHAKAPAGSDLAVYVDITTPTTVNQGEAFTLDLDLDVIRRTNGVIEIVDEDEFAEHSSAMSYPSRLVTAARDAAESVLAKMEAVEAPFDGSHKTWLAKLS